MKKLAIKAGVTIALLGGVATVPVIPQTYQMDFAYQYPASSVRTVRSEHKVPIQTATGTVMVPDTVPGPDADFKDTDKNGLISVAVFVDKAGKQIFIQIPDATYRNMGDREGQRFNPSQTEYSSLLEAATARAAIARDTFNHKEVNATSVTQAHTVTGTNTMVFALFSYVAAADNVTGCTYNGNNMTQINKLIFVADGSYAYMYGYMNGTGDATPHNEVCSASVGTFWEFLTASYSGVDQTQNIATLPTNATSNTGVSSLSTSVTPTADNSWIVAFGQGNGVTAGTNLSQTGLQGSVYSSNDTNGPISPAAATTIQVTGGVGNFLIMGAAIGPAVAATPIRPMNFNNDY